MYNMSLFSACTKVQKIDHETLLFSPQKIREAYTPASEPNTSKPNLTILKKILLIAWTLLQYGCLFLQKKDFLPFTNAH
jgi:hypothetical protein